MPDTNAFGAWLLWGMGTPEVCIALGVAVLAVLRVSRLERRHQAAFTGAGGNNFEVLLTGHLQQVQDAAGQVQEMADRVHGLEANSRSHLQRLGLVRYNPFRDTGGDQSFAIALADADGNGAVISSLHNREATRIYAKPLATWQSAYPLTEEESQAINQARRFGKTLAS